MLLELILPRTDAGALVQLVVTLMIGVPLLVVLLRRKARDPAWFVGGLLLFTLGVFAVRTLH